MKTAHDMTTYSGKVNASLNRPWFVFDLKYRTHLYLYVPSLCLFVWFAGHNKTNPSPISLCVYVFVFFPEDKLEQQHALFTQYKDPCRLGPGEDKPWALGNNTHTKALMQNETH